MQAFDIYVSATTPNDHPLRGETMALVIEALRNVPSAVAVIDVQTAMGYWTGERQHTVILTVIDDSDARKVRQLGEYLTYYLRQESVMVVSGDSFTDSVPSVKTERDFGVDYTIRDGMGQRPYAYLGLMADSDVRPTHYVTYVNAASLYA